MSDGTSNEKKRRFTLSYLHLPTVLIAALVSMGSGGGNPGCGGDEAPSCSEGCAVEGMYKLTFEDTSALKPECEAIGLSLPASPLVLSREGSRVTTKLAGFELSGTYWGGDDGRLILFGSKRATDPDGREITVIINLAGSFSQAPNGTDEAVTFSGTFGTAQAGSSAIGSACDVERSFTAVR